MFHGRVQSQNQSFHYYPKAVTFGFITSEDVKKISVVDVRNPESFNALGHPNTNGLYDPLMGPYDRFQRSNCPTCHQLMNHCPGHYGHIELPLPTYHPLFQRTVIKILKQACPVCRCFLYKDDSKAMLIGQLELLRYGLITEAQLLAESIHVDEDNEEEVEAGEIKMKKKGGTSKVADIEEKVLQFKEAAGVIEGQPECPPTRSVESIKESLLKNLKERKTCMKCKGAWKKIVLYKSRVVYSLTSKTVTMGVGSLGKEENVVEVEDGPKRTPKSKEKNMYLMANDAREFLRELWMNDKDLFCHLFPVLLKTKGENPTDVFFLDVIPVIPPKFRPCNFVDGTMSENGQSKILRGVIVNAKSVRAALTVHKAGGNIELLNEESKRQYKNLIGNSSLAKLQSSLLDLQQHVDMISDSASNKDSKKDDISMKGFRQVIERKEGLFRMNMMGKRVNYAARSVITPDPNLDVEEVGIPEVFAKTLTFPTPVTSWNVYEMRKLVENGPNIYPGANAIEDENGRVIQLNADNRTAREAQAKTLLTPSEMMMQCNQLVATGSSQARRLFKPKIVHRHLHNGDILLINRQPTLHKPSMMAHKARVLKGEKTLRLHYANCKAYNADFDGDEMNAHFPQNQVARSEGYNIVGVAHQYLVPKDGTPLSGLIQDHMIAGVKLTLRGQFFTRADYQQLVFAGLSGRSYGSSTKLLPPTIWKPEPLWSGKQVLSTIILNLTPKGKPLINMKSTAKISVKDWQKKAPRRWLAGGTPLKTDIAMTESEVIICHGELMCGVLDKMHYGATSYGLIHAFNELYGGQYSCRLLSSFSRVFTTFLQLRGFTLGVRDILITPEADQKRREIISRVQTIGNGIAARAVGVDPKTTDIDVIRQKLREAHLGPSAVKRMTVDHEYKGETDKITNEVNRACIPGGLLRQFPDNNLSLMIQSGAKGSSVNAMQISCLLGQIELEGKRPPLMISGRSLPSFLPYDTSPRAGGFISGRFMTGIRPQEFFFHCMAGREGLIDTAVKTSRSGYLQRCLVKHLEGISVSYDQTVRDSDGSVLQFLYGEDGLDICKSRYLNEKGIPFLVDNRECIRLAENSPSIDLEAAKSVKSASKSVKSWLKKNNTLKKTERTSGFLKFSAPFQDKPEVSKEEIVSQWRDMPPETKNSFCKKLSPPDPVNGHYPMERHLDVIDEHLTDMMRSYIENPTAANISEKELLRLIYSKSLAASCHPGEPVGVLAAQSIGEPSTQMTLNTFHFAGRGEMNVTLGIPRLREILMTGSTNMLTPSMDLPLRKKGPRGLKQAEKLRLKLTRVTLADVLEKIDVTESLSIRETRNRIYALKFHFLPRKCYKDRFCVKPEDILQYFEDHFIKKILLPGIKKEINAQGMDSLFVVHKAVESRKATIGEEDENKTLDENGALPIVDTKKKRRDEDESDDDESEAGDEDDFDAANRREQRADVHEYDEEEDDSSNGGGDGKKKDIESGTDDEGFEDTGGVAKTETEAVESEEETVEEANTEEIEQEMELKDRNTDDRQSKVVDLDDLIRDYDFDTEKSLYCRLTLSIPLKSKKVDMSSALRRWASSAVVHHVPNIKRAFVVAPKTDMDDVVIKTDGVNIEAMFAYSDILDINRLYSNDVHAISRYYGVEAASRVLVNEIRNVFKVYGIDVDSRHLTLVASYMTSGGGYRAFSRVGMADCTSPLQQMTFETATAFLQKAVLQGKTDYLKSPSSRLVLGLPGVEGTGSFGLLQSLY